MLEIDRISASQVTIARKQPEAPNERINETLTMNLQFADGEVMRLWTYLYVCPSGRWHTGRCLRALDTACRTLSDLVRPCFPS